MYILNKNSKDSKRINFYTINSVKCKHCGHSVFLSREKYTICSWCGYYVFKNKKIEFNFRLERKLRHELNK